MFRVGIGMLVLACAACAASVRPSGSAAGGAAIEPVPAAAAPAPSSKGSAIWPPRMPCAGNFESVPLGKWAEYEETYLDVTRIKERVALVAREEDEITIETTTETRPGDRTVFATVFAGKDPDWRVTRNVFQVSEAVPMDAPPIAPAQQPYPRVDPKKLLGTEMVKVRAGLFRAQHYRYRTAYGELVDFWIDASVAPIGLIKLEAEQKQLAGFHGGFKFELVATGSGAIPQITRAASPFDPTVLEQRGLPWTRQARVGPQPPAKVIQ
jgi:hypothetical protein